MSKTLPPSNLPENLDASTKASFISLVNGRFYNSKKPNSLIRIYPNLTFYRGYIINHYPGTENIERTDKQKDNSIESKQKEYNGYMSRHTSSKVKRILTAWLTGIEIYNETKKRKYERTQAYITFLTLTLPSEQIHDDNYIKRYMLMPFIEKIKRLYNVEYYFWKAEKQKNNNIHFHLIIDKYIDNKAIQEKWNETLSNYQYIDNFEKKYKHRNPPSTHIRRVEGIANHIDYVIKYCTKDDSASKVEGRIWGISDKLRNIEVYKTEDEQDTELMLKEISSEEIISVIQHENYNIILTTPNTHISHNKPIFSKNYREHYLANYYYLYKSKEPYKEVPEVMETTLCKNEIKGYEQLEIFKKEVNFFDETRHFDY